MQAFAGSLSRYAEERKVRLVWRVVDGLHAYDNPPFFDFCLVPSGGNILLDWLRPEVPLSQLNALLYGLRLSHEGDVLAMNPDMPDNLLDAERFVLMQERGAKLVFARRVNREGIPRFRYWLTGGFSAVARLLLCVPLRDFNSTMMLVSEDALACLEGAPSDCPVPYLWTCWQQRAAIREVSIDVCEFPGKRSSYTLWRRLRTSLQHFREMLLFRLWLAGRLKRETGIRE